MPLSDAAIRAARPQSKDYKLHDGTGLYLLVSPAGGRLWRFKFSFNGKEQVLALGKYPEVGLKDARLLREDNRKLVAQGIDPRADKKQKVLAAKLMAANTFRLVADELIAKWEMEGRSITTLNKNRWFASLLDSAIGDRPVAEIKPMELLEPLRVIEKRGARETAKRTRAFAARVFRYAKYTGRTELNPATDLGGALAAPKVKHHAAILEPDALGGLLRAIDGYDGHSTTRLALRLAPHLFVRPGELRTAEWSEIHFEKAVWLGRRLITP